MLKRLIPKLLLAVETKLMRVPDNIGSLVGLGSTLVLFSYTQHREPEKGKDLPSYE